MKTESQIFSELSSICISKGYIHALSHIIYRDNIVVFGEKITKVDYEKIYRPDRLIRTEIAVLIGLWLQGDRSLGHPGANNIKQMVEDSDRLLTELHAAILAPAHSDFVAAFEARLTDPDTESPLGKAAAMREAIFYAAESAFTYQYLELAASRYGADDEWLIANKGFTADQASVFFAELIEWLSNSIVEKLKYLTSIDPNEWQFLEIFCFTLEEAAHFSTLDESVIKNILKAFSSPSFSRNQSYARVNSLNEANILPFVELPNGKIVFFLEYVGCEAAYSAPAYWMRLDLPYSATAAAHRGEFAERETLRLLSRAFPNGKIFRNVIFRKSKNKIAGELDVVVIHGRRAFFFQIKSKGLTEVARSGDDIQISRDFELAVQSAYNQAVSCVRHVKDGLSVEIDGISVDQEIFSGVTDFYPICVTSENYPSLSFQVAQFLKTIELRGLNKPIVLDIFTLDVITEFLRTPLYLVDYLNKRSGLFDKILSSHELNIFGMHLRSNLHVDSEINLAMIQDDFALEVDMALGVRRRGLPGADTPEGLLTRDLGNPLGRILRAADISDRPDVHLLGELLLSLSSDAWSVANRWITKAIQDARVGQGHHDVTIPITDSGVGLTVHCNSFSDFEAQSKLLGHCEVRKYIHKSDQWFGVLFDPQSEDVRLAIGRLGKWKFDPSLEAEARDLRARSAAHWVGPSGKREKVGRNQKCICGSGRKYKHCCLNAA
ncbi:MAG: SEC-C metal-binding domain-containing protein [Alteraurantiacibacter sp.]